jgi:peptide methionine sulfoxide reductase msrA/msrB
MKLIATIAGLFALIGATRLLQHETPSDGPGFDRTAGPRYSKAGYDLTPLTEEQVAAIVKTLTPLQVDVTQNGGTERAGSGTCLNEKRPGVFVSVVGGLPLFRTATKFESGTGWPSFTQPFDPDHLIERVDESHGMRRTEVIDARSGAHLGHVFDDGPGPTGKRYCINAAAVNFIPEGEPLPPESRPVDARNAYFAGGCFWGVEDVFTQIPGVMDAVSGYQGGKKLEPTYKEVCSGQTGHAESVRVVYDPARVAFADLLKVFFDNHAPTTLNRQGPDRGTQYRSAIFADDEGQAKAARAYVEKLGATERFATRRIVTQIEGPPAPTFWPAEEYHQDYHLKHGGSCQVIVR